MYMANPMLEFVADFSKELFSRFYVDFGFDSFGFQAVDDTEYAPALVSFGDDNFEWVRGGGVDAADFRRVLDLVEDVDGVGVFQEDDEGVSAGEFERLFGCVAFEVVVIAFGSYEAGSGAFAEADAELDGGYRGLEGFVEVFHGFDEVGRS